MTGEQIQRILKVCIIATVIMLIFEVIFSIPAINDFFRNWITSTSGWVVFVVIWLIMFLQCTILNIPAYVVLSASISIGIECMSWQYLLIVITAYMAGCITAYWLGRWLGVKAVKWCAGSQEEFDKWSNVLNTKGKWWYALTVLLPLFPDDLLCLVAGAVKFNFGFYVIVNAICRSIGLVAMILTLQAVGSIGGGIPLMIIVWAVALIIELIIYLKINKKRG